MRASLVSIALSLGHQGGANHRPGRRRGLLVAVPALPQQLAAMHLASVIRAARRTDEPVRPAGGNEVLVARFLGRKALLELQDARRVCRPWYPTKREINPDPTNRIPGSAHSFSPLTGSLRSRSPVSFRVRTVIPGNRACSSAA